MEIGDIGKSKHSMDKDERFPETGGERRESAVKRLNTEELRGFIEESLENRQTPTVRVIIGEINEAAQRRIETVCGKTVKNMNIDNV